LKEGGGGGARRREEGGEGRTRRRECISQYHASALPTPRPIFILRHRHHFYHHHHHHHHHHHNNNNNNYYHSLVPRCLGGYDDMLLGLGDEHEGEPRLLGRDLTYGETGTIDGQCTLMEEVGGEGGGGGGGDEGGLGVGVGCD